MDTLSVMQSLLIALWVAAVMSRWLGGGATLTLRFSPLMTGLVVGIVMGDVAQAMIVTAALQMIYMGVFSPGGSMPAEPSIAAAIAVPIASFVLFVPLVFIALYLGAPVIADVINALEGTVVIHILEVVGGGLAAIGIATTVYVIGRKDYMVFFFLAYFMSVVLKSLEITMVTYAIFGILIALIFVQSQKGRGAAPAAESAAPSSGATFDDDDDYDDGF